MKTEKKITFGRFKIKVKTFICAVVGSLCFSSLVWAANCAFYMDDNIYQQTIQSESGGNPCSASKLPGDSGGWTYGYGLSQYTFADYLASVQKNQPEIWAALGGGSLASMKQRAKNGDPSFVNAWKNLCKTHKSELSAGQTAHMKSAFYEPARAYAKKNFGYDLDNMPPEVQSAVLSAWWNSPGKTKNDLKAAFAAAGNPPDPEKFMNAFYDHRYNNCCSGSACKYKKGLQNRWAKEKAESMQSYKIRKAWEAEQANPSNPPKTLEDIVQEMTGKRMCKIGEVGSVSGDWDVGGSASNDKGAGKESATGYEGKDCSPSQYANTMNFCLFCPLFKVIFNTSSTIAQLAFQKLSQPVMILVLIGFAIWIALKMLTFLSSVEKKEAPALIKEIIHMSFVVMVVVLLLQGTSSQVFSLLMEPVFNTGFKLAQLVAGNGECKEYGVLATGGLPASMGNSILCTIEAIQNKLIDTLALGTSSMCVGFFIKASFFIFPSLPYVFSGLLIWGGAFVLMIIFPFLMLDSIFQLTVACALLPAAIGSYPFKYTQKKFVGKVWDTFINAMFNFIFLSIFIFVLTTAIELTLKESIAMSREEMDQNYMDLIVTQLAWAGVALLKIVFVLLLGWALMDEVKTFADNFSAGIANGSIGSKIGGLAGQGTKALGVKSLAGIKNAGKAVGRDISQRVGNVRRGITEHNLRQNGTATPVFDDKGNQIGTSYSMQSKSWLRGRDKVKSVTIANNGTKLFTTQKDYGNGKIKTTQQDGFIKITTTNDNGTVSEKISMQSAALKSLTKKDGSINTLAWDNAIANSAHAPEKVKAALMLQYAKESIPGINPEFMGRLEDAQIEISTDNEGNEVISVKETQKDGSSQVIRMKKGKTGRALLEVEATNKYGERENYATDGIINRHSRAKVDKDGNILQDKDGKPEIQTEYAVSGYYTKYVGKPVNSNGNFHSSIPADQIMFDDNEMTAALKQMVGDRLKGKVHAIGGFK